MLDIIFSEVAIHFCLTVDEIKGKSKDSYICQARRVAMGLLKKHTIMSYPQIGKIFNRNHSTVMHNCNKVFSSSADMKHLKAISNLMPVYNDKVDILEKRIEELEKQLELVCKHIEKQNKTKKVLPNKEGLFTNKKDIEKKFDEYLKMFVEYKDQETRSTVLRNMYNLGLQMKQYDEVMAQMYLNNATSTARDCNIDLFK